MRDFLLAAGIVELTTKEGLSLIRLKDTQRDVITATTTESLTPQPAYEQGRGRDTSLAVVTSEAEDERRMPLALVIRVYGHDDQGHETPLALANGHVAPSESKDDHGEWQETSPASASPKESDVHEHEHQTPLESEDEHKVEHETSSAPASSENIQRHEDEQQGIGMTLTLEIGSEQEDETTPVSQSGPEQEGETSSIPKNEPEQERGTFQSPSKTDPEQQGIGMPLTLEFGPEHGDETTQTSNSGPEIEDETSPTSQNDSEQERETSSLSKTDPEPEQPEPEPKPKTTPLSSLAQSFSFSERR